MWMNAGVYIMIRTSMHVRKCIMYIIHVGVCKYLCTYVDACRFI